MSYLYKISSIKKWALISGDISYDKEFIGKVVCQKTPLTENQKEKIDTIYSEKNVKNFLEAKEVEDRIRRTGDRCCVRDGEYDKKRKPKGVGQRYPLNNKT